MISCLCVTYNRPQFHEFLLWNFKKQTFPDKELVVVDGSDADYSDIFAGPAVKYIRMPGEANIPKKRNRAILEAGGKYITWFDDDDWQHPKKCEFLVNALDQGAMIAGCSSSFFYNLQTDQSSLFSGSRLIFNSLGVLAEQAQKALFDEKTLKASDSKWQRQVLTGVPHGKMKIIKDQVLFFWLCHDTNISNPSKIRKGSRTADPKIEATLGNEMGIFKSMIGKINKRDKVVATPVPVHTTKNVQSVKRSPSAIPQSAKAREASIKIVRTKQSNILVGINVWNQFEEARETYLSFRKSMQGNRCTADFLVVDDCSEDPRVREYFEREAKSGNIHYIKNAVSLRLTKAWNVLLSFAVESGYEYVIQSNADVRFPGQWLERFVRHLAAGREFLVPVTNQPGRFNGRAQFHVQDIRRILPGWKDNGNMQATAEKTLAALQHNTDPEPIQSCNGFFIGFRTDFLKQSGLGQGRYWSEDPRYLAANRGMGGDESEMRKRTGVQVYLAKDVYIHHTRPYGQDGKSRAEFLKQRRMG